MSVEIAVNQVVRPNAKTVSTTCAYCGVGCGVVVAEVLQLLGGLRVVASLSGSEPPTTSTPQEKQGKP